VFTSTSGLRSYSLSVLMDPSIRVLLVYKGSQLHFEDTTVWKSCPRISHTEEKVFRVQNIVHNSAYITWKQPSYDITKCTSPLT